jgi:hypothetical protein
MANKGNQNSIKHGGEGAIRRISEGKPLIGMAHDMELTVKDDLETKGRAALVVQTAIRLQAAAELYWNAVSKAAQDGNIDALDRYIARYGWLAGVSLRAWAQVKQESKDDKGNLVDLSEYREDNTHE